MPTAPPGCRKARIPPYSGPAAYLRGRWKPVEQLRAFSAGLNGLNPPIGSRWSFAIKV